MILVLRVVKGYVRKIAKAFDMVPAPNAEISFLLRNSYAFICITPCKANIIYI